MESRKRLSTFDKGDNCKSSVSQTVTRSRSSILSQLDAQIANLEHEIEALIQSFPELSRNYQILISIVGVGPVTGCELIIKTENFRKLDTARKCASYAGIAPYPNESGTKKHKHKISPMGDKQLKTLLFLCARSAKDHNKEMRLYFLKNMKLRRNTFSWWWIILPISYYVWFTTWYESNNLMTGIIYKKTRDVLWFQKWVSAEKEIKESFKRWKFTTLKPYF